MNVLILVDRIFNHYDNMKALLGDHSSELSTHKNLMKLSPDFEAYQAFDANDKIYGVYAYVDSVLVGYSINIISPHLHYKELICAYNDLLFVDKTFREKGVGDMLMRKAEEEAKSRGAALFLQRAKPNTALYYILDNDSTYNIQEITFTKEL